MYVPVYVGDSKCCGRLHSMGHRCANRPLSHYSPWSSVYLSLPPPLSACYPLLPHPTLTLSFSVRAWARSTRAFGYLLAFIGNSLLTPISRFPLTAIPVSMLAARHKFL